MDTATPAARAAARPAAPAPGPRPALPPRHTGPVRPTWDDLGAQGAVRLAAAFHAAPGDLSARPRPGRGAPAAAQGRRTLRLLPVAVGQRGAAPGRFAAERGDGDPLRDASPRTLARVPGADTETRAARPARRAVLAAAPEAARPGGASPRAA